MCVLTGGVKEVDDWSSGEDELANSKEPLEDDLCNTNYEQTKYSAAKDENTSTDGGNEDIQLSANYWHQKAFHNTVMKRTI